MNDSIMTTNLERYARPFARLGILFILIGVLLWNAWGIGFFFAGLVAFLFACRCGEYGFLILGPFVRYELIRISRREKLHKWRLIYGAVFVLLMFLLYMRFAIAHRFEVFGTKPIPISVAAELGQFFFTIFIVWQFLMVFLLTPSFTADVIAQEKELKSMEFLLTTDLRNREIILGKLAARVVHLVTFLLISLPVFSIIPFFGGVDPNVMAVCFIALFVTLFGIVAIAAASSVASRAARQATGTTYSLIFLYLAFSGVMWLALDIPGVAQFPSSGTWKSPIEMVDLVEALNAGNPISALVRIMNRLDGGEKIDYLLPLYLQRYLIFYLLVIFLFGWIAINGLRILSAIQSGGKVGKKGNDPQRLNLPRMTDEPVFWREIYCEAFWPRRRSQRTLLGILVIIGLVPIIWMLVDWVRLERYPIQEVNALFRLIGTLVLLSMISSAANHACRAIGKERQRQTLDSIYLTTLTPRDILAQKWWGAVYSIRFFAIWVLAVYLAGCFPTAVSVLSLPLIALATMVYLTFAVSLGIWCSVTTNTPARAMRKMYLIYAGIAVGSVFLVLLLGPILFRGPDGLGSILVGMFPPSALGGLTCSGRDLTIEALARMPTFAVLFSMGVVAGLILFGCLGRQIWNSAVREFEKQQGEEPSATQNRGA